jgi:predicted transcriptional regulator
VRFCYIWIRNFCSGLTEARLTPLFDDFAVIHTHINHHVSEISVRQSASNGGTIIGFACENFVTISLFHLVSDLKNSCMFHTGFSNSQICL